MKSEGTYNRHRYNKHTIHVISISHWFNVTFFSNAFPCTFWTSMYTIVIGLIIPVCFFFHLFVRHL
ncbi:transmembrane protein, putative [Medicago truncatula]|uniref:Transmembrane protein, putative n=1 Tax=Medicago truncatula TaxID=3880 RepID=G7IF00_MEDTR|nr:transmembrane protein, putative [Medicago truncatula]